MSLEADIEALADEVAKENIRDSLKLFLNIISKHADTPNGDCFTIRLAQLPEETVEKFTKSVLALEQWVEDISLLKMLESFRRMFICDR